MALALLLSVIFTYLFVLVLYETWRQVNSPNKVFPGTGSAEDLNAAGLPRGKWAWGPLARTWSEAVTALAVRGRVLRKLG